MVPAGFTFYGGHQIYSQSGKLNLSVWLFLRTDCYSYGTQVD